MAMWVEAIVRSGEGGCKRKKEAGREIEFEECEVGVCEAFGDVGIPSLRPVMWSLKVPGRAMGVEVSHKVVVTTEVKERVTIGREIGGQEWGGMTGISVMKNVQPWLCDFPCNYLQKSLAGNN